MTIRKPYTRLAARAVAALLPVLYIPAGATADSPRVYSPNVDDNLPTSVFFGDVHVHTGLSADAGGGGTRLMPADAYQFARGDQLSSNTGQPVKLRRAYDFLAVADHSDGMGMIADILAGDAAIMADPYGRELNAAFNAGGQTANKAMYGMIARFSQGKIPRALLYEPGNPAYRDTWEGIVQAAEEYNDPGVFTTLIGYEWTSLVSGDNLHRVVLFRDNADKALQIEPYTTTPPVGSRNPRDLWKWLASYEEKTGGKVLAIPHNGDLSNGMMFPLVDEFNGDVELDEDYLRARAKWEPLVEVTQPKGDGETHPLLSPDDEFADYETWDTGNLDLSAQKTETMLAGEYAREALKRGLLLQSKSGVNPYHFGMIGSSDIHTALSTPDEDNFFGKTTADEPSPGRSTQLVKENKKLGLQRFGWEYASPGLVAVWAQENTRTGIYDAMARKEAYATTGTRLRVRFFGGYEFEQEDALSADAARVGYGKGVPMGGDLGPAPKQAFPTFLISAQRDPMGANLDRIQIIKGWVDNSGDPQEKVYDVAWSGGRKPNRKGKIAPVGSTVELATATWTNSIGESELSAVWVDPDFDSTQAAFYYARVIEIPTPRWTAYDRVRYQLELPKHIPVTVQERAYTSPIWYTPSEGS